MGIHLDGYPHAPSSGALNVYFKITQRRRDCFSRLYLILFKPNGLLYVYTFQIDEVKAKRLFCFISYCIDRLDVAFDPSERTITGHIDQSSYRQDSVLHGLLRSFLMNQVPLAHGIRLLIPDRRSTSMT